MYGIYLEDDLMSQRKCTEVHLSNVNFSTDLEYLSGSCHWVELHSRSSHSAARRKRMFNA